MKPFLYALLVAAAPLAAQQPTVQVALAPNGPTVGDPTTVTLTLSLPAGLTPAADPRFPAWSANWGEAEVVSKTEPAKTTEADGAILWQQKLVVTAFRPGRVPLPPVAIAVPLQSRTVQATTPAGLSLDVRSVLPAEGTEPEPALKPERPLQALPVGERFWWTLATALALCLGAALLLWWRLRARAAGPAVQRPLLPPFEELTAELDRLRTEASIVQAHTRISLALRRYLGRVLPFPAVESTTSEVQRQLLSRRMPGPVVRQAVELLRACDLVKFARQEAGAARTHERVEAARSVARELETHLAPPEKLEAAG